MSIFQNTFIYERAGLSIFSDQRFLHILESLKFIYNDPIFGVGPGNYQIVNAAFYEGTNSHNAFLEITLSYGIFGLAAYTYLIYSFLKISTKSTKASNYKSIFIFSFALYSFFYITYLSPVFMGFAINSFLGLEILNAKK